MGVGCRRRWFGLWKRAVENYEGYLVCPKEVALYYLFEPRKHQSGAEPSRGSTKLTDWVKNARVHTLMPVIPRQLGCDPQISGRGSQEHKNSVTDR